MTRITTALVLFLSVAGPQSACGETGGTAAKRNAAAATVTYPAPLRQEAVDTWPTTSDGWRTLRPGDAQSPRFRGIRFEPEDRVRSASGAIAQFGKTAGLSFSSSPVLERLDAWKAWDGSDHQIGLARTPRGGNGIVFLLVTAPAGTSDYTVLAWDMPRSVWRTWGGVARMLVLREVIPNIQSFPSERISRIADAPAASQLKVFEAAQDKQFKELSAGLAMAQGQTLLRMRELNFDLLLGNDITSPNIAD